MPWPLVAMAVVAAGSAVYSGISASNTASSNSQAAQDAATWNANQVRNTAAQESSLLGMTGQVNAMSVQASANINNATRDAITGYNTSLIASSEAYNQGLLAESLDQLYESEELDILYLDSRAASTNGAIIATQGASGTIIGEGSNADVLISSQAQAELDKAVLMHQYNWQAADILNAQAKSQYDANVAIQNMNYETQLQNYASTADANNRATNIMVQTYLQQQGISQNAEASAQSISMTGSAQATSYNSMASQSLTGGVVSGIGSAASTYAGSYKGGGDTINNTTIIGGA